MNEPRDLNCVTAAMARLGFRLVASDAGGMDAGSAEYSDGRGARVTVWKDRSEWSIGESREVLEPMGFWRVYRDVTEFCEALTRFVNSRHA